MLLTFVGDEIWWCQLNDFGDGLPKSTLKDVTNIEIQSSASTNRHRHDFHQIKGVKSSDLDESFKIVPRCEFMQNILNIIYYSFCMWQSYVINCSRFFSLENEDFLVEYRWSFS